MALVYSSMPLSPLSRYSLSEARSLLPMLANMLVTISMTCTESPPSSALAAVSPISALVPTSAEVRSTPLLWICSGYSDSVSSSTDLM